MAANAIKTKKVLTKMSYKNTLLNFSSSLMKYYGLDSKYPSHALTDYLLSKKYRHVAVILLDGMGYDIIEKNLPNGSILKTHQVMKINSVCPATTSAATTSLLTGKAPIETGWIGWHEYLDEKDPSVILFQNKEFYKDVPFTKYQVQDKLPVEPFSNNIKRVKTYSIFPQWNKEFGVANFDEALATLKANLDKDEANFTYLYWDEPDYSIHEYGTTNQIVKIMLREFDSKINELSNNLPDNSIVFILADHGLVDCDVFELKQYPDFKACLRKNMSLEARFASFNVKKDKDEEFKTLFNKYFGEHFELYTRDELIKSGACGTNTPHPLINTILGDYIAVATSNYAFCEEMTADTFRAFHAGFTKEEMEIPVILLKRKDPKEEL